MLSRGPEAGGSAGRGLGPVQARLRGLVGALACGLLLALLSCSSPPRTQNPNTLWVSFGQTELELVLVDAEPPYY